ncbi:MAG: hypothetical protein KME04_17800 [Pleurocapsa minor GSE-CHR-MK-17-07R]|nr:hypothetical protein [Pleurocapsa minor GSE-CHR-MK 17-07R]
MNGTIISVGGCVNNGLVTQAFAEQLRNLSLGFVGNRPIIEFSAILDEGVQAVEYLWRPNEGWSRVVLTSLGTVCA